MFKSRYNPRAEKDSVQNKTFIFLNGLFKHSKVKAIEYNYFRISDENKEVLNVTLEGNYEDVKETINVLNCDDSNPVAFKILKMESNPFRQNLSTVKSGVAKGAIGTSGKDRIKPNPID